MRPVLIARRLIALVFAAALLVFVPLPGAAQTPFTAVGLGYPAPPVDARAAALGGVGVGLLDGSFTIRNPADIVSFSEPSLGVTAAPEGVTLTGPDGESPADRNRFSVIRAVVPLGAWSASVGFGSYLDQDWAFRRRDTVSLSTGRFPFEELRENDGGVSTLDVSVARRVGPLSLGLSGQRLSGNLRQLLDRRFEVSVDSAIAAPRRVERQTLWSYEGWRLTAGAGLQLGDRVRVSGAYSFTTELEAENDSLARRRTFGQPSQLVVGASARPADDWLLTAGGGWTSWSEAAEDLSDAEATDVTWGGAGVEFRGWSLGSVPIQLRVGGRLAELPFRLPGRESSDERAVTFGLGSTFASGRAAVDLGVEVGSRGDFEAAGTEESFTRFTFTATVHQ